MNRTEEGAYWQVIWDKFKDGDRRAFETIYNEFTDALFTYGSRLTNHRALVEDAIQDLFLDVYKYGTRLKIPESLEFYLYKTLRRIIIRKLKEKNRFTHPDHFTEQFDLKFPCAIIGMRIPASVRFPFAQPLSLMNGLALLNQGESAPPLFVVGPLSLAKTIKVFSNNSGSLSVDTISPSCSSRYETMAA